MVSVEYMVAYSQVLEILKYVSKEDYNKVPKDLINVFKDNCYKNSDFKYDPEKTLQEQNVSKLARTIIAVLYRDFWATDNEREIIINVQKQERLKQKDYNDIFKKSKIEEKEDKEEKEILPTTAEKESFLTKIKNFFKNIFKK